VILEQISQDLGLKPEYLIKLAKSASHRYKLYKIKKRTKGLRLISQPSAELKLIQRWLVDNIFSNFPVHKSVYSYKRGISISQLAKLHRKNKYLLRVDFKDFFHSIVAEDIYKLLINQSEKKQLDLTNEDISTIISLVCKKNRLTIGSPSSPIISNTILYEFDKRIYIKALRNEVIYSRYADDIYFSANRPNLLNMIFESFVKDLKKLASPKLYINQEKTVFSSKKNKRIITGLIITPEKKVSIGRGKKRIIKSMIHKYIIGELMKKEISYLRGYIAYINNVEPSFLDRLKQKYGNEILQNILNEELITRK